MSTPDQDSNPFLPAIPEESLSVGELVGLPTEVLAITIVGAEPALDRQIFLNLVDNNEPYPVSGFVSEPPYTKILEAEFSPWKNVINYKTPRTDGLTGHSSNSIRTDTLWAETELGLQAKVARQAARKQAMEELVAGHPLGEGGLILTNEFGGINPYELDETARHLVLRTIIAGDAGLDEIEDLIRAGLLNQLLGELMGKDIAQLMENVGTLVKAVQMIPLEARVQAGPAILSGAYDQTRTFVEAHTNEVIMASQVLKNPDLAKHILNTKVDMKGLETWSSSSQIHSKLPFAKYPRLPLIELWKIRFGVEQFREAIRERDTEANSDPSPEKETDQES